MTHQSRLGIVMAALLLASAFAAAGPPRFSFDLSLRDATLAQGASVVNNVTVNNTGTTPITVHFATNEGGMAVAFDQNNVNVITTVTVHLTVRARTNTSPGLRTLDVSAVEWNPVLGTATSDAEHLSFDVTIVESSANNTTRALHAPLLSPAGLSLHAQPGKSAEGSVTVRNVDEGSRTFLAQFDAPAGWTLIAAPAELNLSGGAEGAFVVRAQPRATASNATGIFRVENASIALDLRVDPAPPTTSAPPTASTEPPPTTTTTPVGDETMTPTPTSAPAEPTPTPLTAPQRVAAILRVEPATWRMSSGGRANGTVIVQAPPSGALDVSLVPALPPGFSAKLSSARIELPAGGETRIPFEVVDDRAHAGGTAYDANVLANDSTTPPAAFRIVLESGAGDPPARFASGPLVALALAAGSAGLVLATRRKTQLFAAILYTRLRPNLLIDHPQRGRILHAIGANPGLSYGELQRALGAANGVVSHHTTILERAGAIVSVEHGQHRLFFLAGTPRAASPRERLAERVEQALRERGPLTQAQLADALGVTRQTVHYHAKRLRDARRIEELPDRRLAVTTRP